MKKQQAIQAAADAAAVWTQASHDYGPLSNEAFGAGAHASIAVDDAIRAGATPQDLKTSPNT